MSAAVAAAAAAASIASSTTSHSHSPSHSHSHSHSHNLNHPHHHLHHLHHHQSLLSTTSSPSPPAPAPSLSRYESQKRRDWNTFGQYLKNHRPPLALSRCSGAHVLEFLRYLDQFGKTKVHADTCPFYGQPNPPAPCPCPLRQAWGSLDALIGRLRAAFEENGGQPETNPFGARAVRLYLREVRDSQAKARGIAYEKKKRKKPPATTSHHYGTSPGPPNPSPSPSTNNNNVNVSPSLSGYDDHDLNYDRNNGGMSSSSSARGSISSMIPLSVFN